MLQKQKRSVEAIVEAAYKGRGRTIAGTRNIAYSGEVVADLGDEVQNNSKMAHSIATTIKQQLVGLNYIQTAMQEIKLSTSDNSDISLEVVQGSHSLNRAIAELLEVVDQWETPEFYLDNQ